jgi:tetratricopeptide (TPR) repeat protein
MGKFSVVFLVWAVLLTPITFAQNPLNAGSMSFSDLIGRARYAMENDQPTVAIPILKEIISRAVTLEDRGAQKSVQMARLQLGSAHLQIKRWDEARNYAEKYLANEPQSDMEAARMVLCQAAFGAKEWQELSQQATQLLGTSLSLKNKSAVDQLHLQALYNLEKYEDAQEMIPRIMESDADPEHLRMYRMMQMRCLFEMGDTDKLVILLPTIFRGESRYDITFNLMLLRAGDQMFDKREYRKALAIYRLVMPKPSLMAHQQERLNQAEAGGEGDPEELRAQLKSLKKAYDYDTHISRRAAQIYSELKRYWEAVVLFEQIYEKNPTSKEGHTALFQKLLILYEMGVYDEAVSESLAYLDDYNTSIFPRLVCAQLAQHYLQQNQLRKVLGLRRYADRWQRSSDPDVLEQETNLHYLLGFVRFKLLEHEEAFTEFDQVIRMSPRSQAAIDSGYWKAMCRLLQQNYEVAFEQFMNYRRDWPRASFAADALYRAGVCEFGLEDYEGAKKTFTTFIEEYPDDAQMPSVLSMYGDLQAADGLIDDALASYKRAVDIVRKQYAAETDPNLKKSMVAPASYAVMQAAQALKADAEAYDDQGEPERMKDKYNLIIDWMDRYKDSFGEDANWAQAVFWIGKAQMELGKPDDAVKAYLNAVLLYGTDPAQEGIASILFDLVGMIKNRLPQDRLEPTILFVKEARNSTKSLALQIRLDVLLADLDGTKEQLGKTLLAREKDLTVVPPSALGLMCSSALGAQDFSRSEEFFETFAEYYENSPFRAPSFQLLAIDLFQQGKIDEAFDLAISDLGTYGAAPDVGWAQLMKGNIEVARGEYKTAVDTYNMIFGVRAWRGPICAEAMFRMAEAWEKQANYEKAFAFYQRTYLLYKAYDEGHWAAEGYLGSARCLNKLGRGAAARNTYRALLLDEYVRDLPQAKKAMEILGPEETVELLAGGTNTIETIILEGSL